SATSRSRCSGSTPTATSTATTSSTSDFSAADSALHEHGRLALQRARDLGATATEPAARGPRVDHREDAAGIATRASQAGRRRDHDLRAEEVVDILRDRDAAFVLARRRHAAGLVMDTVGIDEVGLEVPDPLRTVGELDRDDARHVGPSGVADELVEARL